MGFWPKTGQFWACFGHFGEALRSPGTLLSKTVQEMVLFGASSGAWTDSKSRPQRGRFFEPARAPKRRQTGPSPERFSLRRIPGGLRIWPGQKPHFWGLFFRSDFEGISKTEISMMRSKIERSYFKKFKIRHTAVTAVQSSVFGFWAEIKSVSPWLARVG